MKRLLIISDTHCGHAAGLTPPDFDTRPPEGFGSKSYSLWQDRRHAWRWYSKLCAELKPDALLVNGDAIDGDGKRTKRVEYVTLDIQTQCDMAEACIKETGAPRIFMSYGSPYHVGVTQNEENRIARAVDAEEIGYKGWIHLGGKKKISYRHHIGRSTIPHGRATSIFKSAYWDKIWAIRKEYPDVELVIRSHVHYYIEAYDSLLGCIITPALQGYGSGYGAGLVDGVVDFGIVWIDVNEKADKWSTENAVLRFTRHARDIPVV